ncbi:entericidin A/B family lipoprotein [Thiorhodococcus fuscus]|uniref:Entericidin A/B family lipoprotein n=1 Tax=Thiorhodococcus fuscus TaxID=527200 RepID=A0ABW4Y5R2_9GAMM
MRHAPSKMIWLLFLLLPLTLSMAGCNTMAGVGEDLKAAGGGIEKSAESNKDY